MSPYDVELASDSRAVLGEGPAWDERDGTVLWIDIPQKKFHRFHPGPGTDETSDVSVQTGAIVPRASGGFLLAVEDGFATIDALGDEPSMLASMGRTGPAVRTNDGKCDPVGRFWAGTMDPSEGAPLGALYRLDPDRTVTCVQTDITISNGLGWSPDQKRMYYIDTPTMRVDMFDYDIDTGEARDRRPLVRIPDGSGIPDGMTVDADGCLWVAFWDGGAVRRYTPEGKLDREVRLPVSLVTSCCFAGADLGDLYITCASIDYKEEDWTREPHAGGLFVLRPGVSGMPTVAFAG